jgi:hypothetical protein
MRKHNPEYYHLTDQQSYQDHAMGYV